METRLLKMFCAVAERGSLVGAAGQMHLTNSALSHGIKSLETELGCRLFERVANKMVLNQAGEQLLAAVRGPLAALETAGAALRQLAKWGQTRLRIGASAAICQHLLPSVFRELKKAHAHLELQVETAEGPELVDWVHANRIDLAIALAPESQAGLQTRPLFRDELMFVFAPGHAWAAGGPISRESLRTQPLIVCDQRSLSVGVLHDFFKALEVVPTADIQIANIEAIKELVKLNLGVAVLPPWTVDKELGSGTLRIRPLSSKPLVRRWVLLCLTGRRLDLAGEEFCKFCRRHATALRLDRKDLPHFRR